MPNLTNLSRSELRELGRVTEGDRLNTREWWRGAAFPAYRYIYDAITLSSTDEIPLTDEEFYQWLREEYPGADYGRKRSRLRRLWAAGLLLFFIGGYYWTHRKARVAPVVIRGALDKAYGKTTTSVMADCMLLRTGQMSLSQWEMHMTSWIKMSHIGGAILAAGGLSRISDAGWDVVNKNISFQLDKLHKFAGDIARGLPLDGNVCRRMKMYFESGRMTYHDIEARYMADKGYLEYANVLTANESCSSCIEESNKGFVPYGALKPIGARDCLSNCKCYFVYRNPTIGEIDDRT